MILTRVVTINPRSRYDGVAQTAAGVPVGQGLILRNKRGIGNDNVIVWPVRRQVLRCQGRGPALQRNILGIRNQ